MCGLVDEPFGRDATVGPPIGPLAALLDVINSAAISLIVDKEQVDDNDTDEDEASVAIISVVMAVVKTIVNQILKSIDYCLQKLRSIESNVFGFCLQSTHFWSQLFNSY